MLTPTSFYTSWFPHGKGGTGGIGRGLGSRSPISIGGGPSKSFVPPGVTYSISFEGEFLGVVGVSLDGTNSQLEVSNSS